MDRLSNLELFSPADEGGHWRQALAPELDPDQQALMEPPPVPDEAMSSDEAVCSW